MKGYKKSLALVLILTMLLGITGILSGCGGGKKAEKQVVDHVFKPTFLEISDMAKYINTVSCIGDRLYVSGVNYDENWNSENIMWSMNLDGTDRQKITMPKVEENMYMGDFYITQSGERWIYMIKYVYDEKTYEGTQDYYLNQFDEEGKIIKTIDVGTIMKPYLGEETYFYTNYSTMDNDGNLIFEFNNKIYVLSTAEGKIKCSVDFELENGNINKIITDKSGRTMLLFEQWSENESGGKYAYIDFDTNTISEAKKVPSTMRYNLYNVFSDSEGNLYYMDSSEGIFKADLEAGTTEEIVNWVNSDISEATDSGNMMAVSPECFAGMVYDYTNDYKQQLMVLTKVPDDQIQPKYIISLAGVYISDDINKAVVKFNRANSEYRIKITDYSKLNTDEDYEIGNTTFNNDIVQGKIPDIIFVPYEMQVENYISKGMFLDLYKLMNEDEAFVKDDYLQNVFKAYEIDGKLYELVPQFSIGTLAAKTKHLNGMTRWNMNEFSEYMKNVPEGVEPFYDMTRDGALSQLIVGCYETFVDVNEGTCHFDGEEFKKLLLFTKGLNKQSFWETFNGKDEDYTIYEEYSRSIQEDRAILNQMYLYNFRSYMEAREYTFYDDFTMIGYPSESGNGAVINGSDMRIAISARSQFTDGAWDFCKYILSDSYQDNVSWCFPVKKSSLDKIAQKQMEEYNGNGDDMIMYSTRATASIVAGDYPTQNERPKMTQADVDAVIDIIKNATRAARNNTGVLNIVSEEVGAYYDNKKDLESTVKTIQSRAQIYINQNR